MRVEGLDGDGVLKERRGAFEGNRLPERSVQEEEGDPRVDAAEADDAVAVERVGGAGKHGFPAVFAEKRPLELGGKELPNVEEIVSSSRDTSDEENGVEIGETGEMGASGGKRKFEKVVGEKGAVRRRERRDGLDEVKDRLGVVEHREFAS